ncbi:MAG: rhodanese-like domain-containing protein [bacterium]|nr:rhodanese-like domain-containing protein [bacterium]
MNSAATGRTSIRSKPERLLRLCVLLLCGGLSGMVLAETIEVPPTLVAQWQEQGQVFLLVDTRPAHQFGFKHIRGALNVPAFAIGDKPLPKASVIVVYDAGAGAAESAKAADSLEAMGFARVYRMEGGMTAWQAEGLPIVVEPGPTDAPLVEMLPVESLDRLLETNTEVTVVDLRPIAVYRDGHLPGALAARDLSELRQKVVGIDRKQIVVLYDAGDGKAGDLGEQLRRDGYRAVKTLYGGMKAWSDKGLRIEK